MTFPVRQQGVPVTADLCRTVSLADHGPTTLPHPNHFQMPFEHPSNKWRSVGCGVCDRFRRLPKLVSRYLEEILRGDIRHSRDERGDMYRGAAVDNSCVRGHRGCPQTAAALAAPS